MARIAGIDLPKDKRIEIGLTYIYGIGRKSAKDILEKTGVNPDTRVKDLTEAEENKLREAIDHEYTVEGDLRRSVALDIKRLSFKSVILILSDGAGISNSVIDHSIQSPCMTALALNPLR